MLSSPQSRRLIHQRQILCQGFLRDDGLWEVEGSFTDTKAETYHDGDQGDIPAGVPLHGMLLRIAFDVDAKIHHAEAVITHAPFASCNMLEPVGDKLVGLTMGKGFMSEARHQIGGIEGCTHILELLSDVAGTAFQTLHDARKAATAEKRNAGQTPSRPSIIDTCYALRADGPVVHKLWPEHAKHPKD